MVHHRVPSLDPSGSPPARLVLEYDCGPIAEGDAVWILAIVNKETLGVAELLVEAPKDLHRCHFEVKVAAWKLPEARVVKVGVRLQIVDHPANNELVSVIGEHFVASLGPFVEIIDVVYVDLFERHVCFG